MIFKAYAQAAGIDAQKVKWISADSAALPGLLATGSVDAIGQFTVGEPLLAAAVKPRSLIRLAYKDAGLDYYANGIIATEATIKDNPRCIEGIHTRHLQGHARCLCKSHRGRRDHEQVP